MNLLSGVSDLLDEFVGFRPILDGEAQVAAVVEMEIQPDHTFDIVGVVAALEESSSNHILIEPGLVELSAGLFIAERNTNRGEKSTVGCLVMGRGVAIQLHH